MRMDRLSSQHSLQTHDRSGFQPFPVLCPGAPHCRPTLICSARSVPTGPAAHSGPAASFPAPVDSMQGRGKERSLCRWRPRTCASSLAARMSSRLCRRKSTCPVTLLAVHAADAYEEECDGSIHARHHTLLPLYGEALSSPPHNAAPSATGKREERLPVALALAAAA